MKTRKSFTLTALIAIVGISPAAIASAPEIQGPISDIDPTQIEMARIEDKVWASEESDLYSLHHQVVKVLQQRPGSAWAHYLLSHLQVRQFSTDPSELQLLRQASELAQQAVDLEPRSEYGFIALADILDLMGYSTKAATLLDEAEASGIKTSWRFPFTRARLISDQKQGGKVLRLLDTALKSKDSQPSVIVPYIVAVLQNDFVGEELIEKIVEWNKKSPHLLFEQTSAKTYSDLGNHKKALEIYAKIQKHWPQNKEAKINGAIIMYRNLKRANDAIRQFESVLATSSGKLESGVEATIRVHLGAAYLSTNKAELAKANFLRSMKIAPDVAPIINFAAKEYRTRKQLSGLVDFLSKANQEIPGTGLSYALLGETLSESLKDHTKALRAFKDAITLEPERSDYYNQM